MPSQLEQIRDQQRETWDKFSSGWKKWDELVLNWLAPVGQDLIRSAALEDDSTFSMSPLAPASRGSPLPLSYRRGWSLSRIFLIGRLRSLQKTLGVVG
jgi:hypothetical protein